jgi:hypothetical protein
MSLSDPLAAGIVAQARREVDGADTHRESTRVEAFDLLDTRPRILGGIWL